MSYQEIDVGTPIMFPESLVLVPLVFQLSGSCSFISLPLSLFVSFFPPDERNFAVWCLASAGLTRRSPHTSVGETAGLKYVPTFCLFDSALHSVGLLYHYVFLALLWYRGRPYLRNSISGRGSFVFLFRGWSPCIMGIISPKSGKSDPRSLNW